MVIFRLRGLPAFLGRALQTHPSGVGTPDFPRQLTWGGYTLQGRHTRPSPPGEAQETSFPGVDPRLQGRHTRLSPPAFLGRAHRPSPLRKNSVAQSPSQYAMSMPPGHSPKCLGGGGGGGGGHMQQDHVAGPNRNIGLLAPNEANTMITIMEL